MLNLNIKGGDKMSVFVVSKHADNKFIELQLEKEDKKSLKK